MKRLLLTLLTLIAVPVWAEPAAQLPARGLETSENYVRFNASETYLTLDAWGELRVWDLSTLRLVKHLKFHEGEVLGHDVSPDGRWMALGLYPRRIQVLSLRDDKTVMDFSGEISRQSGGSYQVAFSPDGKHLMAYGASRGRENVDPNMRVWRTSDWQRTGLAKSNRWAWGSVVWAPWSQVATVRDNERELQLRDPVGLKVAQVVPLPEEGRSLQVLGDQLTLTVSSDDDNVVFQQLRRGETIPRRETRVESVQRDDRTVSRLVGDLWLSAIGYGGPATVYAGAEPRSVGTLEWACPPDVSPSGKLVALATKKGVLILDAEKTVSEGKLVPYRP